MIKRAQIGVYPAREFLRYQRLLEALGRLYPADFVALSEPLPAGCDAVLVFGMERTQQIRQANPVLRCVTFIQEKLTPAPSPAADISFSRIPFIAPSFRGRTLPDKTVDRVALLKPQTGDEIVARKGDEILWLHRGDGSAALDLVAIEPPEMAAGEYLFQYFSRDSWIRVLPVAHLLREITADSGWTPPPLRAAFMFDDPNLHWPNYGYVRYPELAQHAREHNYHVSFATVPMDGWYVNRNAAALFREHKSRLSLLVHGNQHTPNELAALRSEESRQSLMAQALERVARLEQRSGVEVSRIMAAPHGACSDAMAQVLLRMGFEAACISRGSIMHHNRGMNWPVTVGLNPAEFLGGGLPIIPRWGLTWIRQVDLAIAALLGQAMIPVGHHDDLKGGLDLMREVAGWINSMGTVQWGDLKAIARSNFFTRRENETLHVKMFSRRIHLVVPEGVEQLYVQRPWLEGKGAENLKLSAEGSVETKLDYLNDGIKVSPGVELQISSICPNGINPKEVSVPRTPLWAVTRRNLCELRDRLRPMIDGLMPS